MGRRALVTGITGQDGSYLSEFLLEKGYNIYGLVRRVSSSHACHMAQVPEQVCCIPGDILDMGSLLRAVEQADPHEVYHLAAFSHVGDSFTQPVSCFEQTGLGTIRLLEAVRMVKPETRFYQASSSEMFGNTKGMLHERSPMHPRSPYGVAKLAAHAATRNYREAYGLFACCGILFNHESPRRGLDFVTRKIARHAARGERVTLGNLNAYRDWGWAPDYVRAMWLMLQQNEPDDYVIATGETHTVGEFAEVAYTAAGWVSERTPWHSYIDIDYNFFRPADIDVLVGDFSKAKEKLGWHPTVKFRELVARMVYAETQSAVKDRQVDNQAPEQCFQSRQEDSSQAASSAPRAN